MNIRHLTYFLAATIPIATLSFSCTKKIKEPRAISVQEAQGLLLNQFAVLIDLNQKSHPAPKGLPVARLTLNEKNVDTPEKRQIFVKNIPEKFSLIFTGSSPEQLGSLCLEVFKLGRQADWVNPGDGNSKAKTP